MKKEALQHILDGEKFNRNVYSLSGGSPNDRLCLAFETDKWCVYYSERGSRFDEEYFASEDEACDNLLRRLRELPPSQTRQP